MNEKKGPSKTILLIDDEKDLCEVVSEFLKDANYKVVTASDGAEGLRKYENQKFDLIITDLKMPKKSGVDVINSIRLAKDGNSKQNSGIPIVVLSGNIDVHKPRLALIENLHLFYKPFNREELLLLVDCLLKDSRILYKQPTGENNELLQLVSTRLTEMIGVVLKDKGKTSEQTMCEGPTIISGEQIIEHPYTIGTVDGRLIYTFSNGLGKKLTEILTKSTDASKINSSMVYQALDMFGRALHSKIGHLITKRHKDVKFMNSHLYSGEAFISNSEKGFTLKIVTEFGELQVSDLFLKS